jgi:hypothetical protein
METCHPLPERMYNAFTMDAVPALCLAARPAHIVLLITQTWLCPGSSFFTSTHSLIFILFRISHVVFTLHFIEFKV